MVIAAIALAAAPPAPPAALNDYLARPDRTYSWKLASRTPKETILNLTSQTWHGVAWRHTLALVQPKRLDHKGVSILVVTGGDPNPLDMADAHEVADLAGMPVAVLFHIPNQPTFDRREDELIAYTFEQCIRTGDSTWPLLFPMAKSAIRAMDALEAATKGTANPVRRFVVTGESKRGWTTWFVGASGDKRVVGIAPMIIDNLNLKAQMPHQLRLWGKYSEMIEAYTRLGLQEQMRTPQGLRLAAMVDPYSYRARIKAPTLIVNGSNDPYWATDALSLYWDGLTQPKSVLYVANARHELGDKKLVFSTLSAFSRSCAGEFKWPTLRWSFGNGVLKVIAKRRTAGRVLLWRAESDTLDFRGSTFAPVKDVSLGGGPEISDERIVRVFSPIELRCEFDMGLPKRNRAYFVEIRFQLHGRPFSLCTRTWIEKAK